MADSSSERKATTRQYHPYQDLQIPIQNLYNLPTSPEYLFDEEAAVQRRSWSENLQYYTGSAYLGGAIMGGAKGSFEGLKAAEPGDTLKLRINRVLNSGGQTGRRFGNSLGVVGLIFAGLESGIEHCRGTDDLLNSVLAGLGTGRALSGSSRSEVDLAVIPVISLMQDTTETFTSISKCHNNSLETNAFIEGKSAACIDLDVPCSNLDNRSFTLSRRFRSSPMEEWRRKEPIPCISECLFKIFL
ncbi:hypothetical protein F0562_019648 [Nyssa sinensis]|uniref:Mitochondrial import inner membrane translocase subunit TIM23 n=1 Tax=Nyssa sinensis TaxID=561372 RepID=A0A5J5BT57_9ASTE|nr:hypothetical protein F0562_019648 [Nyssa sinensis]